MRHVWHAAAGGLSAALAMTATNCCLNSSWIVRGWCERHAVIWIGYATSAPCSATRPSRWKCEHQVGGAISILESRSKLVTLRPNWKDVPDAILCLAVVEGARSGEIPCK
jgi:hypothetical protein